jgi:hypothetical protein
MSAANYQEAWAQLRKRLEPARLSNLQTNADLIAHYVYRNGLSGADVNDLLKAVWALHGEGKLLWDVDPVPPPTPKAKSPQELAAETYRKDLAARNRAHEENTKPVSAEEKKRLANEAALARQLQEIFENFRVYRGPGIVDYQRTNELLGYLRTINIQKGGKTDTALTLAAVKSARFCETVADMKRAVEKFLENYNNENNPEYHKQRQHERESRLLIGPTVRNYAE